MTLLHDGAAAGCAATPLVIGVRHHSPACARLVAARIRATRPAFVLIEGPADFNARLDELALPHQLPIAIYSYLADDAQQHGWWTPFAEHSPEWQALCAAREVGAALHFIDLPAWHAAVSNNPNRYADIDDQNDDDGQEARADAYLDALGRRLGVDGGDALWDHLFEDETDLDALDASLAAHFTHLRGDAPGSPANAAREAMMADWIGWAMAQARGQVLVVCGGYHAPALARLGPLAQARHQAGSPAPATPAPEHLRHGSFLVPTSFKRLDAFAGYAAGMPSPAWYAWLWAHGPEGAGRQLLQQVLARLRARKLPASTADLMAVQLRAHALCALRGHHAPLRSDWLDALAGTLVSDALEAPLPWSYRGPIRAGTDPILVHIMDVLAGDQPGQLAPGTPQPPLVASFRHELTAAGLAPGPHPRSVELDLLTPEGRRRSQLLHRAALLDLPGIVRNSGPAWALAGEARERWTLSQPLAQQAALIEAGAWGATLLDAARARLEEHLRAAGGQIEALAATLDRAAFAGLAGLGQAVLSELQQAVAAEARFEPLGVALGRLFLLLRHGHMLGIADAPVLRLVIDTGVDRALWLLEPPAPVAPGAVDDHVAAMLALRRIAQDAASPQHHAQDGAAQDGALTVDLTRMLAVFERKVASRASAPLSRGAALGAIIALGGSRPEAGRTLALALLDDLAPALLGDAVSGLLALARETLQDDPSFIAGLDARIQRLSDEEFVLALPALRAAFGWLPSRERGKLAGALLALHGASHLPERQLLVHQHAWGAEDVAAHRLAEQHAMAALGAWGIAFTPHQSPP